MKEFVAAIARKMKDLVLTQKQSPSLPVKKTLLNLCDEAQAYVKSFSQYPTKELGLTLSSRFFNHSLIREALVVECTTPDPTLEPQVDLLSHCAAFHLSFANFLLKTHHQHKSRKLALEHLGSALQKAALAHLIATKVNTSKGEKESDDSKKCEATICDIRNRLLVLVSYSALYRHRNGNSKEYKNAFLGFLAEISKALEIMRPGGLSIFPDQVFYPKLERCIRLCHSTLSQSTDIPANIQASDYADLAAILDSPGLKKSLFLFGNEPQKPLLIAKLYSIALLQKNSDLDDKQIEETGQRLAQFCLRIGNVRALWQQEQYLEILTLLTEVSIQYPISICAATSNLLIPNFKRILAQLEENPKANQTLLQKARAVLLDHQSRQAKVLNSSEGQTNKNVLIANYFKLDELLQQIPPHLLQELPSFKKLINLQRLTNLGNTLKTLGNSEKVAPELKAKLEAQLTQISDDFAANKFSKKEAMAFVTGLISSECFQPNDEIIDNILFLLETERKTTAHAYGYFLLKNATSFKQNLASKQAGLPLKLWRRLEEHHRKGRIPFKKDLRIAKLWNDLRTQDSNNPNHYIELATYYFANPIEMPDDKDFSRSICTALLSRVATDPRALMLKYKMDKKNVPDFHFAAAAAQHLNTRVETDDPNIQDEIKKSKAARTALIAFLSQERERLSKQKIQLKVKNPKAMDQIDDLSRQINDISQFETSWNKLDTEGNDDEQLEHCLILADLYEKVALSAEQTRDFLYAEASHKLSFLLLNSSLSVYGTISSFKRGFYHNKICSQTYLKMAQLLYKGYQDLPRDIPECFNHLKNALTALEGYQRYTGADRETLINQREELINQVVQFAMQCVVNSVADVLSQKNIDGLHFLNDPGRGTTNFAETDRCLQQLENCVQAAQNCIAGFKEWREKPLVAARLPDLSFEVFSKHLSSLSAQLKNYKENVRKGISTAGILTFNQLDRTAYAGALVSLLDTQRTQGIDSDCSNALEALTQTFADQAFGTNPTLAQTAMTSLIEFYRISGDSTTEMLLQHYRDYQREFGANENLMGFANELLFSHFWNQTGAVPAKIIAKKIASILPATTVIPSIDNPDEAKSFHISLPPLEAFATLSATQKKSFEQAFLDYYELLLKLKQRDGIVSEANEIFLARLMEQPLLRDRAISLFNQAAALYLSDYEHEVKKSEFSSKQKEQMHFSSALSPEDESSAKEDLFGVEKIRACINLAQKGKTGAMRARAYKLLKTITANTQSKAALTVEAKALLDDSMLSLDKYFQSNDRLFLEHAAGAITDPRSTELITENMITRLKRIATITISGGLFAEQAEEEKNLAKILLKAYIEKMHINTYSKNDTAKNISTSSYSLFSSKGQAYLGCRTIDRIKHPRETFKFIYKDVLGYKDEIADKKTAKTTIAYFTQLINGNFHFYIENEKAELSPLLKMAAPLTEEQQKQDEEQQKQTKKYQQQAQHLIDRYLSIQVQEGNDTIRFKHYHQLKMSWKSYCDNPQLFANFVKTWSGEETNSKSTKNLRTTSAPDDQAKIIVQMIQDAWLAQRKASQISRPFRRILGNAVDPQKKTNTAKSQSLWEKARDYKQTYDLQPSHDTIFNRFRPQANIVESLPTKLIEALKAYYETYPSLGLLHTFAEKNPEQLMVGPNSYKYFFTKVVNDFAAQVGLKEHEKAKLDQLDVAEKEERRGSKLLSLLGIGSSN